MLLPKHTDGAREFQEPAVTGLGDEVAQTLGETGTLNEARIRCVGTYHPVASLNLPFRDPNSVFSHIYELSKDILRVAAYSQV